VRHGETGIRAPLTGLQAVAPAAGLVAVVCAMIGTVTFDGASEGSLWRQTGGRLERDLAGSGLGGDLAGLVVGVAGIIVAIALVAGAYRAAVAAAARLDRGRRYDGARLAALLAPSLVPIALAYAGAHYVSLLLFQGQMILPLLSDPAGQGWDLLGLAAGDIDYSFIGPETFWYIQAALVILGHVAALALAHDRALVLYRNRKQAARSQYWMLGVMVTFTVLALWLLSEAAEG
jgi:hypothetical protein